MKDRLILELRGMMRLPHVFLYPIDFNLLLDRGQQVKVLNPTKKWSISGIFNPFDLFFLKFLARLKDGLLKNCAKW